MPLRSPCPDSSRARQALSAPGHSTAQERRVTQWGSRGRMFRQNVLSNRGNAHRNVRDGVAITRAHAQPPFQRFRPLLVPGILSSPIGPAALRDQAQCRPDGSKRCRRLHKGLRPPLRYQPSILRHAKTGLPAVPANAMLKPLQPMCRNGRAPCTKPLTHLPWLRRDPSSSDLFFRHRPCGKKIWHIYVFKKPENGSTRRCAWPRER